MALWSNYFRIKLIKLDLSLVACGRVVSQMTKRELIFISRSKFTFNPDSTLNRHGFIYNIRWQTYRIIPASLPFYRNRVPGNLNTFSRFTSNQTRPRQLWQTTAKGEIGVRRLPSVLIPSRIRRADGQTGFNWSCPESPRQTRRIVFATREGIVPAGTQ